MRLKILGFVVIALTFLVAMPSFAADFISPEDKDTGRVVLGSQEEFSNVYTAGTSVQVNSQVMGDLFAVGSEVALDGTVEQDVSIAGGSISIQNKIGGDVRLAGGSIRVNNEIAGDLLLAGGLINISEKSRVGGDLLVAGGQLSVDAPVMGKVWITGGNVYINSEIQGELKIWDADKVKFGPGAKVSGKAVVSSKTEPVLLDGASVPNLEFSFKGKGGGSKGVLAGILAAALAIAFLGYIVIGLLVAWLAPKKAEDFIASVKAHFWQNLGIGFIGFIVVPIVAVLSVVLLVGIYVGLVLLAMYVAVLVLAWIMGLVYLGSLSYMLLRKAKIMEVTWQTAILGALVYIILKFIPIVGQLVICVVMLATLGQWMSSLKRYVVERGSRGVSE